MFILLLAYYVYNVIIMSTSLYLWKVHTIDTCSHTHSCVYSLISLCMWDKECWSCCQVKMLLLYLPGLLLCLSDCFYSYTLSLLFLSFCSVPSACCCLSCLASSSVYHSCLYICLLLFPLHFHCCFMLSAQSHLLVVVL